MLIEIPEDVIRRIPKNIELEQREEYLIHALELGLLSLNQASLNVDTSVVKDTFDEGAMQLVSQIRDLVEDLFGKADSPFHEAMDPTNPKSKVASLLKQIDERSKEASQNFDETIKKMEENHRNELNEIKERLGINNAVAQEEKVGTKKGIKFEEEIIADLQSWQKFPDSFEGVGMQIEGKTKRKVGDIMATMDNGNSIVLEVKAGSDYGNTGDQSLDRQMDEAMAYRGAIGAIAITTTEAMEGKKWQNSIFLERGKNRLIVAVDRENLDFTMVKIAYTLLRERILSQMSEPKTSDHEISADKIREYVHVIEQNMSSIKKLRQMCSDIEGRIEGMRTEITKFNGSVSKSVTELYEYIASTGSQ